MYAGFVMQTRLFHCPMKFWISKNSEVSVREQIVTQVRLGIAARDLSPGERLPSTREMARRFGIHANTVSAAYRELTAEKLIDFRKGSGVFVGFGPPRANAAKGIDALFAEFCASAAAAGFARRDIEAAIDRWRDGNDQQSAVLVESDLGMREIIKAELNAGLGLKPVSITSEQFRAGEYDKSATLVAMFDEREKMQPHLDPGQKTVFIDANSVQHSLSGNEKPADTDLIAIVSCWPQFAAFAKIYLVAAKIDPEALVIRSTSDPNWKAGLDAAEIIICDSAAAELLGDETRKRVFKLVTEASIDRLRNAFS